MKTPFTILLLLIAATSYCQTPIDVTDQTLKIGGMKEELLYFGFAEGDQIVLSFSEIEGKELKEIEVVEYPSNSKFTDFKTAKIDSKTLTVNRTAVYQFRFSNGAVGGRICKIRIQRVPANDQTKNFNTNITWTTRQDTTWNTYTRDVLVGYDTTYRPVTKKEIVKTEQKEELLLDKNQRVHTALNSAGDKSFVFFTLPATTIEPYKTSKVIAWAYWIGVGQEASKAWQQNAASIVHLSEEIAAVYTTPLGALAVGAITGLLIPTSGDDVYYALTDQSNKDLFMANQVYSVWDKGSGMGGYKQLVDPSRCKGTYFITLYNDNYKDPIDVTIKVTAIVETTVYEDKQYTEQLVHPRYEKQIFSDPMITAHRVPVMGR